jgi:[citrate (pro-3S)-lyase] ligase
MLEEGNNLAVRRLGKIVSKKYGKQVDLQNWLRANASEQLLPGIIGALVMNCNPFTLGHLYLVQEALQCCERLFLFVVEEDRSAFPFVERLHMIQEGVKLLGDRVRVLPSGKYVISSFSFPGYFTKEEILAEEEQDPTLDVAVFGSVIAPALGISRRFVGEEPFDRVTAAYNRSMLFLLPPLGVEVEIIPRLIMDGVPVSASRVRAFLRNGDLQAAQLLTPSSTWPYLRVMPPGALDRAE